MTDTLQQIEAELRSIGTFLWTCTVDDPETATIESEAEGMTPERYTRAQAMKRISNLADKVEALRNRLCR